MKEVEIFSSFCKKKFTKNSAVGGSTKSSSATWQTFHLQTKAMMSYTVPSKEVY